MVYLIMIGKQLNHYKIIDKLGEGGMGEVYLAEDTNLNRKTAIKVLSHRTEYNQESKRRFKLEAQAVAALNHPNIVTIFELGEFDSDPFIVMEYVDGQSLRDLLNKRQILSVDEAVGYMIQICEGLARAHFAGIIHRDIKPENILIGTDERIKVLDFGLAKLKGISNITKESTRLGTVCYMSPEQANGMELDSRSDIFSLGILFYELLSGKYPFKGEYEIAILYAIVNEAATPLSEHVDDCPDSVQQIIEMCLKKNPDHRYQTIGEILDDLLTYEHNFNISKRRLKESNLSPKTKSIEELLEHREKIDQIIESKFKKDVVIMFSDIVGSTRFYDQYGDIAGRAMVQRINKLMFPLIKEHSGSIVKTMGDGIMASFNSPLQSCECAVKMQEVLAEDNKSKSGDDKTSIRIALHFGKGVIEKGDIYGDVVNVTARVEKHTKADQIVISQSLYKKIEKDLNYQCINTGSVSLKGKADPIDLYQMLWTDQEVLQVEEKEESASDIVATTPSIIIQQKYVLPKSEIKSINPGGETTGHNPYMNRVMIRNVEEFYGREQEIRKIFSRIGSERPQSVSLVGERRIGKSSVLNYIYNPVNRRRFLNNPDDSIFLYIDFQEKRGIEPVEFFRILLELLILEFKNNLQLNIEAGYEGFKKVISALDETGLKVIMIFDEFDLITKNKNFDSDFYSYMRSLANNYNVAYLVASGRNLQNMCHSKKISDSPFFNIFSNLTLSQFSHPEALELITLPAKKMGLSLEQYSDFILDIAGYYPFFIQMACASLYELAKNKRRLGKTDFSEIKEEFLDEARVHFQQIWEINDNDNKEILLILAAGKRIDPSKEYLLNELFKSGYVKQTGTKKTIFSSLFGQFILERNAPESTRKKRSTLWPFS
jgi:serine/threonine protein kinase/AAA+ ATPase superfamily predicted ATPase